MRVRSSLTIRSRPTVRVSSGCFLNKLHNPKGVLPYHYRQEATAMTERLRMRQWVLRVPVVTAIAACTSTANVGDWSPDGGDAGGSDALSFGDGGPGGALGCSSDLHRVIDGTGNTVKTCPDDQGCSNGACVPACQAAA